MHSMLANLRSSMTLCPLHAYARRLNAQPQRGQINEANTASTHLHSNRTQPVVSAELCGISEHWYSRRKRPTIQPLGDLSPAWGNIA